LRRALSFARASVTLPAQMGRWLIIAGIAIAVAGAIVQFAPGWVAWIGRLPGDLRFESAHTRIFVPITSMLVISLVLTLLLNLFSR